MSAKTVIRDLDNFLGPLGFTRQKATWNRRIEGIVQVIDVQVSKTADEATVNVGVLDTDVHVVLKGIGPPAFVEEPACTVRARVGELIDGKDRWWHLDDGRTGEKISKAVTDHVLPFLTRMCSRKEMAKWLMDANVVERRYPLPIINLAILKNLLGNSSESCSLLKEVQKKAIGAWRARATEIAERLGCAK